MLKEIEKITARLAALGDDRDSAVARAVAAGCTWAEVGSALGVSAQAAHKRFRSLRHDPADPGGATAAALIPQAVSAGFVAA